jgi:hypothetical protein
VLGRILARGGRIAWGVLDPVDPDVAPAAVTRLTATMGSLGQPMERVVERSLLTPGCGTGMLSRDREEALATTLEAMSASMRRPRFSRG